MNKQDYSAQTIRTENGCLLELVPEFGGLTNRLQFASDQGPVDVIAGLPDRNAMETDKMGATRSKVKTTNSRSMKRHAITRFTVCCTICNPK
jgi:hypothetical protein